MVGLSLNSFQTLPLRFLRSTLSSIYCSLSKLRKTEDNWFLLKPQYLATSTGEKCMHLYLGSSTYFNGEFPVHWILAKKLSRVIHLKTLFIHLQNSILSHSPVKYTLVLYLQ